MKMRLSVCVAVVLLSLSGAAVAAPIAFPDVSTAGLWVTAGEPGNDGLMPFSHESIDCPACNLGYVLADADGRLNGFEYLSAPFRLGAALGGASWAQVYGNTADVGGVVGLAPDGAFTLTTGYGESYHSDGAGADHVVLLRRWVAEVASVGRWAQFFAGFEDLPFLGGDSDFQDHVLMALVFVPFEVVTPGCVSGLCGPEPEPIPEPASLALFGLAALGASRWARRR
jgi:hypothetical protein